MIRPVRVGEPTILLVDDRVENLVALEAVLQPLGHPLVRATSGRDALRELLRRDFAVILMDVQMPDMNGFETAQIIKSRERSRHTPIIFLTAISKDEDFVFEGYSSGAVDYIFKPFNPTILRSKVAVFVDLYEKGRELQRQAERLRASERRELELRHRAGLLQSEARFAQIVDSALDAIISFDDEGVITVFNAAAERIFDTPVGSALGTSIDRFLQDERLEGGRAAPGQGSEEKTATSPARVYEAAGRRAGGETFPVEYSLSTLRLDRDTVHTVIVRDISERRRYEEVLRARTTALVNTTEELRTLNEELSERTIELERALGVRSRFYASMSHELRTPINAILGYSSLLLENIFGELSEQQRSSIERAKMAANHLLELVNDILDLSKIEAGKMELQVEEIAITDLVRDLFVTVAPFAEEHGVELGLEICDTTVESDPRRIRQILLNLLSNAIKFGHHKPVLVRCVPAPAGGLVVEVEDHGPGISEVDQERIFEEFVQLEHQNDRGTGLGLPISRRLAELLGGSLSVSSTVGEGSVFRLTLPATAPASIGRLEPVPAA